MTIPKECLISLKNVLAKKKKKIEEFMYKE